MSEPLPLRITIGDKYHPAMAVTTREEAADYFDLCVKHTQSWGHTLPEAVEIEKTNIGYFAGYYDRETADRVMDLYDTRHPVFGRSHPDSDDAFEAGKTLGRIMKAATS